MGLKMCLTTFDKWFAKGLTSWKGSPMNVTRVDGIDDEFNKFDGLRREVNMLTF